MGAAMRQVVTRARQPISVQGVLEWAFGAERAQVEFDELGRAPTGIDTVYLLMQRGALGCKVDGGRYGGGAQSADDAELVAAVVSSLPVEHGGRGMAVAVAQLARAGAVPNWYRDATPRVRPLDMKRTKHGLFGVTLPAQDVVGSVVERFGAVKDSRCCPVRISPSGQEIAAARRFYLDWIKALIHIRYELDCADLDRWALTDELPGLRPWADGGV